jgi:sugar phosphate isomerase/epimerase
MRLGYNTNGCSDHPWEIALRWLADVGYRSVALTVDHHCLNPFNPGIRSEVRRMSRLLSQLNLGCVIETGARFLLDPLLKHEPTLVSTDPFGRQRRLDFLVRCVDLAAELNADAVSFWAGVRAENVAAEDADRWLVDGCRRLAGYADQRGVRLAFEPEPGMHVETFEQFRRLDTAVASPHFGLTVDIGHVHCVEPNPDVGHHLGEWISKVFNIHIEDMRRGVHEHLPFGQGEIDFKPVLRRLVDLNYSFGVHVELSRHSHAAPRVAAESFAFLQRTLGSVSSESSPSTT